MRFALSIPSTHTRGPQYLEAAFAAIHAANPTRLPFTLSLGKIDSHISLHCDFPPVLRAVIEGQLTAAYPVCQFKRIDESTASVPISYAGWTATLRFSPDLMSLNPVNDFEDRLNHVLSDPLSTLLALLHIEREKSLSPEIHIKIRPAGHHAI